MRTHRRRTEWGGRAALFCLISISLFFFAPGMQAATQPAALLQLSPSKMTVQAGALGPISVHIIGGVKPYTFSLSNDNAKVMEKSPGDNPFLHLRGLKPGESVLTVKDARGQTATMKITIPMPPPLKAVPAEIAIEQVEDIHQTKDKLGTVTVSGGLQPYKFTFGSDIAHMTFSGKDTFKFYGVKPGATVLTFKDTLEQTATVKITVEGPPVIVDPVVLTVEVEKSSKTLRLTKGTKPYFFTQSNDNAEIVLSRGGGMLTVRGVKPGETIVTIKDAAGKTAKATVTVEAPPLKADPASAVISVGKGKSILMVGGTKPFSSTLSNDRAKIADTSRQQELIHIQGMKPGESILTVKDAAGKTAAVKITVVAPPLEVPAGATVKVGLTIQILVHGGGEPYSFSLSNDKAQIASALPASVYLKGLKPGPSLLTVKDAWGRTATAKITVEAPPPLKLDPASLTIPQLLIKRVINISGGMKPYTFNISSDRVKILGLEGDGLGLLGAKPGEAVLTVKDASGQAATAKITVGGKK